MTTRVWHPEIADDPLAGDGFATVDDSAVAQLRQSGWLLATERDEHLERLAAHPSQNRPSDDDSGEPGAQTPRRHRAPGPTAGKAGGEGSEQ